MTFSFKMRALAALALLAVSATPAIAGTTIDTTGTSTGNFNPFGQPSTAAYGQTFTVGSDNVLNSFSLYLIGQPSSTVNFTAYIYAWNGTRATGSALYTSAGQIFSGSGSPTEYAFNTGSLALTSGSQYVAFLYANSGAGAQMPWAGDLGDETYTGGDFVFDNAGSFADLTSSDWDGVVDFSFAPTDAWFKAAFNQVGAVPEPGTWVLMLLGFAGVGVALRRDRKRYMAAA